MPQRTSAHVNPVRGRGPRTKAPAGADWSSLLGSKRAAGDDSLFEYDAKQLLGSFGIQVPAYAVIRNDREILTAVTQLKPPLAVKLIASGAIHKSDIGGVHLGLTELDAIKSAAMAIRKSAFDNGVEPLGVLVEEMAPAGIEMLVGGLIDPIFGPTIVLGMGGVYVEVFDDVALRICPIGADDAQAMIDQLRGAKLLRGSRGRLPVDIDSLIAVLIAVGGESGLLMKHGGEIAELDINPLIVGPRGAVAADARVKLVGKTANAVESRADKEQPAREKILSRFEPLFRPKTIAIVGASANGSTRANDVLQFTREFGFDGAIYAVHPRALQINGVPAYPSIEACPTAVDYAFVAVAARHVPQLIEKAAGRLKFAQIMASGFGEHEEGGALNDQLLAAAKRAGVRLLGPNCLGTYSPRGRLSFIRDCPQEVGTVGIVSQSGGIATDLLRRGCQRGLRYSGVVSAGNSVDVGPKELLEFYLADPATQVIGCYLESLPEGRAVFDLLKDAKANKPAVILKGGRTSRGQRVAASHTGGLAGDERIWEALSRQTGACLVGTVEELVDTLLAFQVLEPTDANRGVFVVGNGGGASVLATDFLSHLGIELPQTNNKTLTALAALGLPAGTAFGNPMDVPSGALTHDEGRALAELLSTLQTTAAPSLIIVHLNMPQFLTNPSIPSVVFDNMVESVIKARRQSDVANIALVLRSDGSAAVDDRRREARARALSAGIPVYDDIPSAARAVAHLFRLQGLRSLLSRGC